MQAREPVFQRKRVAMGGGRHRFEINNNVIGRGNKKLFNPDIMTRVLTRTVFDLLSQQKRDDRCAFNRDYCSISASTAVLHEAGGASNE